jgi:hypothetical protein
MRVTELYKYKKQALIAFLILVLLTCITSCGSVKPYNTVYTIKAENIIRGKSYLTGYEEHVICDSLGNVYRIFQSPASKSDSIYQVVKRMSYNRERSMQFYYKIVKPKKLKR